MSSQGFHVTCDGRYQLTKLFGLPTETQCAFFELFDFATRVMIQCSQKHVRLLQLDSGLRYAVLPVAGVVRLVKVDYSTRVFLSHPRCKVRVEV